jgi:hypothetical protein
MLSNFLLQALPTWILEARDGNGVDTDRIRMLFIGYPHFLRIRIQIRIYLNANAKQIAQIQIRIRISARFGFRRTKSLKGRD